MTPGDKSSGGPGDGPSLGERVRTLGAIAGEALSSPVEGRFAMIVCDGCGATVRLDVDAALDGDELRSVVDWERTNGRDYCLRCVERGLGARGGP